MAYKTINDLDSIIGVLNTLSNQSQQKEQRRYRRDASVYDEFNAEVAGTFSNSELDVIERRVENHISQYGGNFNDLSVENFSLLRDKIRFQREDNTRYENGLQNARSHVATYGKHMGDIRAIQNMTEDEFEYDGYFNNATVVLSVNNIYKELNEKNNIE